MGDRVDPAAGVSAGPRAINHVSGLIQFRMEWDEGKQQPGIFPKNVRSDQGHINLKGSATCFWSAIFTPADPEFVHSIEVGVRELVLLLIDKLNCITYSSCEGHPPVDEAPMRQRHVSILPRNEEEYTRLLLLLRKAADATHMNRACEAVRIDIKEALITTEGPNVPGIDILFAAVAFNWSDYSRMLESFYMEFLAQLQALSA
jgi:hypothetical protein